MPSLQILPECYADTVLIQSFVSDVQRVVHIFGIPNVAKEMKEAAERDSADVRIGCVDNDKRVPPYLLTFSIILEENKVLLKRNEQNNQYLIVIDKAIESFLLWNAEQVNMNIINYYFSADIKAFGKALKTTSIGTNANYRQLLTDLRTRQAPGFLTLERILNDVIAA